MICIQVCQLRIVWIIWIRTNLFGLLPPLCLIHFTTFALQFSKCLSGPLKGHFPKLKIGPSNTPPRTSLGNKDDHLIQSILVEEADIKMFFTCVVHGIFTWIQARASVGAASQWWSNERMMVYCKLIWPSLRSCTDFRGIKPENVII